MHPPSYAAPYAAQTVQRQVTSAGARLIDATGTRLLAEWAPPAGAALNIAASSPTQLLVSTGGGSLMLLDIGPGGFTVAGTTTLPAEVACLDISPIGAL